jgi:hypothetical protein
MIEFCPRCEGLVVVDWDETYQPRKCSCGCVFLVEANDYFDDELGEEMVNSAAVEVAEEPVGFWIVRAEVDGHDR